MDLRRARLLAEADDGHLRAAALDRPLEAGVRLDAVDREDAVGAGGVAVEVQRHAVGVRGDLDPVSIVARISAPIASSVMPSVSSIARCPSAVAPPWLPIAGTTNGSAPRSRSPLIVPRSSSTRSREAAAAGADGDRHAGGHRRAKPFDHRRRAWCPRRRRPGRVGDVELDLVQLGDGDRRIERQLDPALELLPSHAFDSKRAAVSRPPAKS